ncbi:MAG: hypothetical protein ACE5GM_05950 [bacterium]
MKQAKKTGEWLALSGAFLLVMTKDAYAYLDPGTGSYIIQMLLAVVVGGFYALKVYWKNIKNFFSKNKGNEDK